MKTALMQWYEIFRHHGLLQAIDTPIPPENWYDLFDDVQAAGKVPMYQSWIELGENQSENSYIDLVRAMFLVSGIPELKPRKVQVQTDGETFTLQFDLNGDHICWAFPTRNDITSCVMGSVIDLSREQGLDLEMMEFPLPDESILFGYIPHSVVKELEAIDPMAYRTYDDEEEAEIDMRQEWFKVM